MTASLQALAAVQAHDTAIDQLERRAGALPERAAAHELNERRRSIEARQVAFASELAALSDTEEEVEKELEVVEQRVKSLDATLRAPGSATRDAQAIIHEVDQLRAQAGVIEERGLELLEQRDTLLGEQTAAQAELDRIASDVPTVLAALKQAEEAAKAERAALAEQRDAAAANVDAPLLATYERMRPRLEGVAVAHVVSGTCTGCHLSLASVDIERMAKLAPGEYATCEQCGRILIPT